MVDSSLSVEYASDEMKSTKECCVVFDDCASSPMTLIMSDGSRIGQNYRGNCQSNLRGRLRYFTDLEENQYHPASIHIGRDVAWPTEKGRY